MRVPRSFQRRVFSACAQTANCHTPSSNTPRPKPASGSGLLPSQPSYISRLLPTALLPALPIASVAPNRIAACNHTPLPLQQLNLDIQGRLDHEPIHTVKSRPPSCDPGHPFWSLDTLPLVAHRDQSSSFHQVDQRTTYLQLILQYSRTLACSSAGPALCQTFTQTHLPTYRLSVPPIAIKAG